MQLTTLRKTFQLLNQRPWFAALALLTLAIALVVAFINIFTFSREGSLQSVIWLVRLGLVFAVVLIWLILNLPPPRVLSSKFIIVLNEFGEETAAGQAEKGVLKAARRKSVITSTFEDVRQRIPGNHATPADGSAQPQASVNGSIASTRSQPVALSGRGRGGSGAADAGGLDALRGPTRSLAINKSLDLNTLSGRTNALRAVAAQNELPTGGRAISLYTRHEISGYVGSFMKDVVGSDPRVNLTDVVVSPAPFAANEEAARNNGNIVQATVSLWGWIPFGTEGVFVPSFEVLRSFEEARSPQGQLQLMGLRSFRLGQQQVRYSTTLAAFIAGLSAYSLRHYDLARNEFNLALISGYLHGGDPNRTADGNIDCSIIYFFLGNVEAYRNDFEAADNAYRNALRLDPQMIEARHNLGVSLYLQGQFEAAVKTFIAVVRDDPALALGRYSLGLSYVDRDQFASARRELNNAKRLNPRFPPVYRALAYAYRREAQHFIESNRSEDGLTGQVRAAHAQFFDDARANLHDALRLKPDYIDAQVDQALLSYEQALVLEPEDPGRKRLLDLAILDLTNAISLSPSLPDTQYHLGLVLLAQERTDEAVETLREAIRLRPNFDAAHLKLGEIYQMRGQRDLAERQFSYVRNKDTVVINNAQSYISLGIGARVEKRYDKALDLFQNALRLEPRNPEATLQLGILYQEMGDLDRAEQMYRDTTRFDPSQVESYYRYSTLLRQRGQERQAFELVQRIAQQYPTSAKAQYYFANALRSQRQIERAIESYSTAIRLDPNLAEARYNLAALYMTRKQYNDAIIQLNQVIILRAEDSDAYLLLADAYRYRNEIDLAIDSLSVAVSKRPEDPRAHIALARIQLDLNDPEAAVSELEVVLQYDPANIAARETLGRAYAATGQHSTAIETLQSLLMTQPNNFSAHYNLGLIYTSLKRYGEAEGMFLRALAINDNDLGTYFSLGVVYREEDKIERAIEAFQQVIAIDPSYADAYNMLGQIYMSIKEVDKGKAVFETYGKLRRAGR